MVWPFINCNYALSAVVVSVLLYTPCDNEFALQAKQQALSPGLSALQVNGERYSLLRGVAQGEAAVGITGYLEQPVVPAATSPCATTWSRLQRPRHLTY